MRLPALLLFAACSRCLEPADSGPVIPVDSYEDSATVPPCDTSETWYEDHDGDGHGDPARVTSCDDPEGASTDGSDCDDGHALVYGGAPELATSGRDDDCDGEGGVAEIQEIAGWSVYADPEASGWSLGQAVVLPGDLDGDGFSDLAVGSKAFEFDGVVGYGGVLVYMGPLDAASEPLSWENADSFLVGASYETGEAITGVGDVDGDGFRDLLIGDRSSDGLSGTWLVRGPVLAGVTELDTIMDPWNTESTVPPVIAGPGDLNGDGLDDVVFCNPQTDGDGSAGKVYVMLGPATQSTPEEADTILRGNPLQYLGSSMASLGDLDGDGLPDLGMTAMGSPGHDQEAGWRTYLVLDLPAGIVHPSETGVTVFLDESGEGAPAGMVVQEVGDVNGDGHADVAFAGGGSYEYLLFGPFGDARTIDLATQWDAAFTAADVGGMASLGHATPLGDWDGDGYPDLAFGDHYYVPDEYRHEDDCWAYDVNLCTTGAVFLVAGPVEGGVYDLDRQADHVISDTVSYLPSALAGGDDLDGDGFPDLAVGNDQVDTVFVLFGGGLY